MNLPKRKPNRLSHYSYSSEGCYFLTLCAVDQRCLFSRIQHSSLSEAPIVQLSNYGRILNDQIETMKQIYSDIRIDHYVIMPNHVHFLLSVITQQTAASPANERVPSFVSALKRMTNKTAGCNLWQRSYHDHVIRDEDDFLRRWKYIEENPARWTMDRFYTFEE